MKVPVAVIAWLDISNDVGAAAGIFCNMPQVCMAVTEIIGEIATKREKGSLCDRDSSVLVKILVFYIEIGCIWNKWVYMPTILKKNQLNEGWWEWKMAVFGRVG